MKRCIAVVLSFVLALSMVGCGTKIAKKTNTIISSESEQEIEKENKTEKELEEKLKSDENKSYTYNVAFANWTDDSKIYTAALNTEAMLISSVQHLPIYKFDTIVEMDSFRTTFCDILTMDSGLDEMPSFEYITATYNDSFFSEKSLILTYVPASSGSYRFGVSDVYCDGQSLCVYIEQLNNPEVHDAMMAGWFALVEVDKKEIANCISFDAQLGKPLE